MPLILKVLLVIFMEETFLNHLDWAKPNCTYLNCFKHQDFWSINSSWAWEPSRFYRYLGRFSCFVMTSNSSSPAFNIHLSGNFGAMCCMQWLCNFKIQRLLISPLRVPWTNGCQRWTHPKSGMMFEYVFFFTVNILYSSKLARGQTCLRTMHENTVKGSDRGPPKERCFKCITSLIVKDGALLFRVIAGKIADKHVSGHFWQILAHPNNSGNDLQRYLNDNLAVKECHLQKEGHMLAKKNCK